MVQEPTLVQKLQAKCDEIETELHVLLERPITGFGEEDHQTYLGDIQMLNRESQTAAFFFYVVFYILQQKEFLINNILVK